jgi:methyl coenzyme M reductase beta subunit
MGKTFDDYLNLNEENMLDKEDQKDAIEAAHNIAKDIFGDDYDKEKAEKLAKDIIKKHGKDNDVEAVIEIIKNALQDQ